MNLGVALVVVVVLWLSLAHGQAQESWRYNAIYNPITAANNNNWRCRILRNPLAPSQSPVSPNRQYAGAGVYFFYVINPPPVAAGMVPFLYANQVVYVGAVAGGAAGDLNRRLLSHRSTDKFGLATAKVPIGEAGANPQYLQYAHGFCYTFLPVNAFTQPGDLWLILNWILLSICSGGNDVFQGGVPNGVTCVSPYNGGYPDVDLIAHFDNHLRFRSVLSQSGIYNVLPLSQRLQGLYLTPPWGANDIC